MKHCVTVFSENRLNRVTIIIRINLKLFRFYLFKPVVIWKKNWEGVLDTQVHSVDMMN